MKRALTLFSIPSGRSGQSGQAMLELTAILVGLVAMTLGLIFVAGLSLADNRTLLTAKANSEWNARNNGTAQTTEAEMSGWSYGTTTVGGQSITVPFSSLDTPAWVTTSSQLDDTATGLESGSYSNGSYPYRWTSPSVFRSAWQSDFSSALSNGFNAAGLVKGTASAAAISPMFGFDESGLWSSGGYTDDSSTRQKTRKAARSTFHRWFGIKISDNQLAESAANQVYMPAGKTADEE